MTHRPASSTPSPISAGVSTPTPSAISSGCSRSELSASRPRAVGDATFWHEGYVAAHDGDPEPEPSLGDYFAFWTGAEPDDIGGVFEQSGLLCWWEAKLGSGWVRETGYFLQELRAFSAEGSPQRVERIWIDTEVEAELRPLVMNVLPR